jgi:polygalacturonase
MTIAHNHFYTGHGMSIGSETDGGASSIRVTDLSIDGADNGLRIKSNLSRGGLVEGVVYQDICIRNTKNPIYMDSNYSFMGEARDKPPVFRGIEFHDVKIEGAGKITLEGLDAAHPLGLLFDNVSVSPDVKWTARHARIQSGVPITGEDVELTAANAPNTSPRQQCSAKFVPMPQ